ncbi:PLP-dependent aminotransferase family protein [Marivibrio halodurans]|uniref:PLP-dependent aminotransferase family protein n=1 Tax=Marivibrio halodurans TaxID=2039722 RepID=A0A8J7V3F4_9PROT|nr:PLP-dependent aminotransferase family protein [Marivibrio halodurans]
MIVDAVLSGQLPPGDPLPSCRAMAKRLRVSRNTVVYAYQRLVDDGFLVARERSGFYVADDVMQGRVQPPARETPISEIPAGDAPDMERRFRIRPSRQQNIRKPKDWRSLPYPFIYGQTDTTLFPLAEWRDCSRQVLGRRMFDEVTHDMLGEDDPVLVEQIRTHLLPRRGVTASAGEILITLGAQNALYLLASLFLQPSDTVVMADPGYPDFRNLAQLRTNRLRTLAVDAGGLPVDGRLDGADYIFVTPSHHFPTTVTMPLARRQALLDYATEHDCILIEDDYEPEANYVAEPTPALKSMDRDGRVIYVGSLSKTLFPGLRLGYLVASRPVVDELRALRRLMLRHPPTEVQRIAGLFIAQGHHDTYVKRLGKTYKRRWRLMSEALDRHLPGTSQAPGFGGTSFWVEGPAELDADALAERALHEGLVLEPGSVNFAGDRPPRNFFRLGFSSIADEKIEPGIAKLAALIGEQRRPPR